MPLEADEQDFISGLYPEIELLKTNEETCINLTRIASASGFKARIELQEKAGKELQFKVTRGVTESQEKLIVERIQQKLIEENGVYKCFHVLSSFCETLESFHPECMICFDTVEDFSLLFQDVNCWHTFHYSCLDHWKNTSQQNGLASDEAQEIRQRLKQKESNARNEVIQKQNALQQLHQEVKLLEEERNNLSKSESPAEPFVTTSSEKKLSRQHSSASSSTKSENNLSDLEKKELKKRTDEINETIKALKKHKIPLAMSELKKCEGTMEQILQTIHLEGEKRLGTFTDVNCPICRQKLTL